MNNDVQTETVETTLTAPDAHRDEIAERLAQISAALKSTASQTPVQRELTDGMACPIDPAERALCEGCQ